ncbi:MAG: DUF6304 family protein [Anaerolineae bacterium]
MTFQEQNQLNGEEYTSITNDGKFLRVKIRGVEFSGRSFDMLDPPPEITEPLREQFSFFLDALCSYELDCEIPISIIDESTLHEAILHVHVKLGDPDSSRPLKMMRIKESGEIIEASPSLNEEILKLTLDFDGKSFVTKGENLYSSFDEQLSELKEQLPQNVSIKTCWSCQYSDYHPAGSGAFGHLACFRNVKDKYCSVKSKYELMQMWEERTTYVQEIHLCEEYVKRKPGIGGLYVG